VLKRFKGRSLLTYFLSLALIGCVTNQRAPVREGTPTPAPKSIVSKPATEKPAVDAPKLPPTVAAVRPIDANPPTHTVKRGETLYSIAKQHGLNYQELGAWNNLANANALREGAELQLTAPSARGGQPGATVLPLTIDTQPEAKPVTEPIKLTPPPSPKADESRVDPTLKTDPKASRIPYSDVALQKIQRGESADAGSVLKSESVPETKPEANPEANPDTPGSNESLQWVWPTSGKIASSFSESSKGLDILGVHGQPIVASADGRVSYIGNSLRGYGKMIVIIHNKSHLSLYAHNSAILVKEGQTVSKGQKIAEMGNSDSEDGAVKLHFEIRRLGKPVDPWKYLPSERSS
jgi:lipoprotein NlpD